MGPPAGLLGSQAEFLISPTADETDDVHSESEVLEHLGHSRSVELDRDPLPGAPLRDRRQAVTADALADYAIANQDIFRYTRRDAERRHCRSRRRPLRRPPDECAPDSDLSPTTTAIRVRTVHRLAMELTRFGMVRGVADDCHRCIPFRRQSVP